MITDRPNTSNEPLRGPTAGFDVSEYRDADGLQPDAIRDRTWRGPAHVAVALCLLVAAAAIAEEITGSGEGLSGYATAAGEDEPGIRLLHLPTLCD